MAEIVASLSANVVEGGEGGSVVNVSITGDDLCVSCTCSLYSLF